MLRSATLFFLVLFLAGCSRFQILDSLVPASGKLTDLDLAYGLDARQHLDVYRPDNATQPTPVVIFFYGGDWQTGAKEEYRFVAQALVQKGYVAVLPDYRLYPQVQFPEFVKDGASTVRWVHDNIALFGGDPRRIYLLGHSAGAHTAALLTLDAHYLKDVGLDLSVIVATAGLSGPYDFMPRQEEAAVFGMSDANRTPPPAMQVSSFARADAPPMLIIHGLKDAIVERRNPENLERRIREAGGAVLLLEYPKSNHADPILSFAAPFQWLTPSLEDVTSFFRAHRRAE